MVKLGMRLSRKEIMEELIKLETLIEHVANSNLNDNDKAMVFELIRRRTLEVRKEDATIERNIETFQSTK